ncbi:MAG: hypothetical protein ACIARR_04205 [Phycisphaerales bacterium JB059]
MPPQSANPTPSDRSVTLIRGTHRWHVSCAGGDEQTLVDALLEHALSDESPLGLEDVALIRTRLAGTLRIGINKVPSTPDRA